MGKFTQALEKSGAGTTTTEERRDAEQRDTENRGVARAAVEPRAEVQTAAPATTRPSGRSTPQPSGRWDERLSQAVSFSTETAESFRVLRSRILHPDTGTAPCRTIMVTSTAPKEGKSFVAANLGIVMAQGVDDQALLVDCDLRRPMLASLFGLSQQQGLSTFLQTGGDIADLIVTTSINKLSILPSGKPPVNPAELLGSARMDGLIRELAEGYDDRFVIFDTPPILAASEVIVLAQKIDGVVLVVRQGASSRTQIRKIIDLIGKDKVIGIVFNGYERRYLEEKMLGQYTYYGSYDKTDTAQPGVK
ncbi:polysaccharide biosynthesis tyrosine autokinase [Desulfoprunum benzoelyticum]|uniref:Exopolysaccharide/PEP-CTERM locus tyrosine autokinase n=1 Tax=Desulfoprunum benzoelyticum TaxID=1506996 RepID=A0A840UW68_9BACT|nr:polysaccharide biosynthesis tyrosine autokinase [Desulfoprunum benzoelyticum]MBB5346948.1 exopolysaccharide/PEP-CTERM locus tyrosine autokinase [Desulfoprunum benzoelyticum]MBM9531034.1 polysaccharide biosynthesis tyrosine autokinase [Desulfoprunum benzoelyticum]